MKEKKISTSVYMIIFLLALCIAGTIAWFINYGTNQIDGTNVTVSSGNVMQVSLDGENYSNTFSINYSDKHLNMQDVSGDGITLYRPTLGENLEDADSNGNKVNVASPIDKQEERIATSTKQCENSDYSNAQYISFDLWFRGTTEMDIYLTNNSKVSPVNEGGNDSAYAANGTRFSKDWIAAASRIAFVDNDQVKMLWAPQSNKELIYDTDDAINKGYKLQERTQHENFSYLTYDSTNKKYVENSFNKVDQKSSDVSTDKSIYTTIKTTVNDINQNESPLVTLEKDNKTGYYVGKVTVNIWIEGCDNEARRALAGGNVNFAFNFVGFENKTN